MLTAIHKQTAISAWLIVPPKTSIFFPIRDCGSDLYVGMRVVEMF